MKVIVRCYGPARRLVDEGLIEVDLDQPATVGRLLRRLAEDCSAHAPELVEMLSTCGVAIGDQIAATTDLIDPNLADDVSLLPPVAGGSR